MLWPVLGVLLYTTFTQVPLIVGALVLLLPDDPAIRLGVLLVLLVLRVIMVPRVKRVKRV